MAMNITEVRLLALPLESDYKHTVYFPDVNAQVAYMSGKTKHSGSNFSYQRKDKVLRYPKHFDELQDCNYIMYRNNAYSNKWFYAFITEMEYINDERTDIHFETDVLQTYMFNEDGTRGYTVQASFIEREHVKDDSVGLHTVPENLEIGEYVCKYTSKLSGLTDLRIVAGVTSDPDGNPTPGARYNGVYSGIKYIRFFPDDLNNIKKFLEQYSGRTDSVTTMFLAPSEVAPAQYDNMTDELINAGVTYYNAFAVLESSVPKEITTKFAKTVGSHSVRNNKLNCYPFRYLMVSNNSGGSAIYQYEHFKDDEIQFNTHMVLTPGCSMRIVPVNYKGLLENQDEGLNLGKFPICNWVSDEYTNWLTQNSVNIGLDLATGIGQIIAGGAATFATGGLAAGVGGGVMMSGASQIFNTIAQVHQMSFTAPQSHGNINCGDVITATANNTFTFYGMGIKDEYVSIIDGYFDMFGYKCNKVKVPEVNHRESWWYTKTIDVNIDGEIPMKDLEKIKQCYNNGITFWRNSKRVGDYSQSNAIV